MIHQRDSYGYYQHRVDGVTYRVYYCIFCPFSTGWFEVGKNGGEKRTILNHCIEARKEELK